MFIANKYQSFKPIHLDNRKWPSQIIKKAPIWCSVDLRDGNQSLANPMTIEQKIAFFKLLVKIGFKQIEVGFPAASAIEYDFLQRLQQENLIPEDVTIQVLTQAKEDQIQRTFQAIEGLPQAIVHVYNSTSKAQREQVFRKNEEEIIAIATNAVTWIKELAQTTKTNIILEYSPESFSGTELPVALNISNAVFDIWEPTPEKKAILNLPATVEMTTPNIFADQIEWICNYVARRDSLVISLHTHNDRGTGIAASELGLLAGGERVEGSLFGNGERTGNLDLVILAYNLLTQGIDPELSFDDMEEVISLYVEVTGMTIHPRHPYVGDLVYTAFSGSHQDAIRKGIAYRKTDNSTVWNVPYLPLDPKDIGRKYNSIVRINSQSGKGGVAYILEQEYNYTLPKNMHSFVASYVQKETERLKRELNAEEICTIFEKQFILQTNPLQLQNLRLQETNDKEAIVFSKIKYKQEVHNLEGKGNGIIDSFVNSLQYLPLPFTKIRLQDYSEHALDKGSDAQAVAYISMLVDDVNFWGVGKHFSISYASVYAVISILNQAFSTFK